MRGNLAHGNPILPYKALFVYRINSKDITIFFKRDKKIMIVTTRVISLSPPARLNGYSCDDLTEGVSSLYIYNNDQNVAEGLRSHFLDSALTSADLP